MRVLIAIGTSAVLLSGLLAQDAKTLLKQVQQKYRQMQSMEATLELNAEMKQGGNTTRIQQKASLAMQKPNKLAMKSSGNMPLAQQEVYSDGKELTVYIPASKQYVKRPAPPDFEGPNALVLGQFGTLLGFASENLDDPNSKAKYTFKGKKTIAGKPTRIVEVTERQGDNTSLLRLYVGEQDKLVYRVEMDQKMQMPTGQQGQPPMQIAMKAEVNIRYTSFNKPIPASRFKFTPPKDAKPMQLPQSGTPTPPPQAPK
jgi:outer membrane lipoprotein-sorting protein